MGMKYSSTFESHVSTELRDLFELSTPTDASAVIISCRIGQESEEGDAAAEMLPMAMVSGRGAITKGLGGIKGTEEALEGGQATAGSGVTHNNNTRMAVGSGSLHTLLSDTWNLQVGWLYQPAPEERITVSPGDQVTVVMPVAPADSITLSGTIVWEEIGG